MSIHTQHMQMTLEASLKIKETGGQQPLQCLLGNVKFPFQWPSNRDRGHNMWRCLDNGWGQPS